MCRLPWNHLIENVFFNLGDLGFILWHTEKRKISDVNFLDLVVCVIVVNKSGIPESIHYRL